MDKEVAGVYERIAVMLRTNARPKMTEYRKGSQIPINNNISRVVTGVVRLSYKRVIVGSRGSDEVTFAFVPAFGIIGELSAIGASSDDTATAHTPCVVESWDSRELDVNRNTMMAAVMDLTLARMKRLREQTVMTCRTTLGVMWGILTYAIDAGDGASILTAPAITHEILATIVGTSREIVTLNVGVLKRAEVLAYTRSGISVDVNALHERIIKYAASH